MQQARFVIDDLAPKRDYKHGPMDYNNDPTTTFANVQKFFQLLQTRILKKLAEGSREQFVSEASALNTSGVPHPEITKADIRVVQRARHLLDSPAKWNRANTQNCPPDAKSFSLYCALATADKELTGAFDDRCPAMREARHIIDEFGPNAKNYDSRLVDYNADPATSFADIQRLLQEVQERPTKGLTRESKGKKQCQRSSKDAGRHRFL